MRNNNFKSGGIMKNQFVKLMTTLALMLTSFGICSAANPVAWITQFSPKHLTVGAPNSVLTIMGGNFVAGSVGRVNGSNRPTIYLSNTLIQVTILTGDVAAPGQALITVLNPTPGGGESDMAGIGIVYPTPTISSLWPTVHPATTDPVTITVTGTGFCPGATVYTNGMDGDESVTTFVNSTTLSVAVDAEDVATGGMVGFVAVNPSPSVGYSNQQFLKVTNPSPGIVSISSSSMPVGSPSFTLTVTGSNFVPASAISFNNSACVTTFISSTMLTAVIPALDLRTTGSFIISVASPYAKSGESASISFSVISSGGGHGKGRSYTSTSLGGDDGVEFSLNQNYPEPFNPTTIIGFDLPTESAVTLKVYNMLGQEVAVLLNQAQLSSGNRQVQFSASNLPSGTYIYRIEADPIGGDGQNWPMVDVKKMTLLK